MPRISHELLVWVSLGPLSTETPASTEGQLWLLTYTLSSAVDQDRLLIFESDGNEVRSYRAGRRDAVELVEGCL